MSQEKSHTVNATGRKAAHTGHMTKRHLPQGHVYSRVPNKRTPPRLLEISKKILKIGRILVKKINFLKSKKALTKTECMKSMN